MTARKKANKRDEDLAPASRAPLKEPTSQPAWGTKSTDLITEARGPGFLRDILQPARMLSLQRAAGNRAVNELVSALNEPGGGRPSPALGLVRVRRATAGSPFSVQRAVTTNGGEFDTGYYTRIENAARDRVPADHVLRPPGHARRGHVDLRPRGPGCLPQRQGGDGQGGQGQRGQGQ